MFIPFAGLRKYSQPYTSFGLKYFKHFGNCSSIERLNKTDDECRNFIQTNRIGIFKRIHFPLPLPVTMMIDG